jgi:cold shock CspA family protein
MPTAKVKVFNGTRGYLDFPSPTGVGDLYFGVGDIDPRDKKNLRDNDEVNFDIDLSDPAKPKAINIRIVAKGVAGSTPKGPKTDMEMFVEGKKGDKLHVTVRYFESGKPVSTIIELYFGNENNPFQTQMVDSVTKKSIQVITDLKGLGKQGIDISNLDDFVTHVTAVQGPHRVTKPIPTENVPTVTATSKSNRFKIDPEGDCEERAMMGHNFIRNLLTFDNSKKPSAEKMMIISTVPITFGNVVTGKVLATDKRVHQWTTPKGGSQSLAIQFMARSCRVTITHVETGQSQNFELKKR